MGSSKLSKSLSQFIAGMDATPSLTVPFENDEIENDSEMLKKVSSQSKEIRESRKNRKKDKFSRVVENGQNIIDDYMYDDIAEDFDGFIGSFLLDDEDTDLKRNLLRYGRKYARDTQVSGESSEITKAYSESEKLLSELLNEINEDKKQVQTDITNMRMMRTRNYKALSDLIESKAQFHNTALSAIKEMNNMKKSQFELQMKVDKSKKESEDNDTTSTRAIQQLFSIGRNNIMDSIGGYEGVSGALDSEDTDDDYSSIVDEDKIIHDKYFNDDEPDTDGDLFLKYEGLQVKYILLYDEDNNYEIIAEDEDGNLIPDYPLPSDPDKLEFNISEATGTATDNFANQYILRHM